MKYMTHHSLTVTFFKFAHLCAHFNTEVDFIAVLANNLQFDVFCTPITSILLRLILKQQ